MHSFCLAFGQYLAVQKLVSERLGGPPLNIRYTFGLKPENLLYTFLTHCQ
jgi:hypothetical protein